MGHKSLAMAPKESVLFNGVTNGAGREVRDATQLQTMVECLVDAPKGGQLVLNITTLFQKVEHQKIFGVLKTVNKKEQSCVIVWKDPAIVIETRAKLGVVVGGVAGAVAGGGCVGAACPPLAPICCLIVGGIVVGAVIGG